MSSLKREIQRLLEDTEELNESTDIGSFLSHNLPKNASKVNSLIQKANLSPEQEKWMYDAITELHLAAFYAGIRKATEDANTELTNVVQNLKKWGNRY